MVVVILVRLARGLVGSSGGLTSRSSQSVRSIERSAPSLEFPAVSVDSVVVVQSGDLRGVRHGVDITWMDHGPSADILVKIRNETHPETQVLKVV